MAKGTKYFSQKVVLRILLNLKDVCGFKMYNNLKIIVVIHFTLSGPDGLLFAMIVAA